MLASKRVTRLEAFLILAVLVTNALCFSINVHSTQTLMYQSGLVLSINFVFLLFGYYMSFLYKSSSLLLSDYRRIYYWAARISITKALVYLVTAAILKIRKTDIVSLITTWTVCLTPPAATVI
jgi:hypothetical protein